MPTYIYGAYNAQGQAVKEEVTASTEAEALQQLKMRGLSPDMSKKPRVKKTSKSKATEEAGEDGGPKKKAKKAGGAVSMPFSKVKSKALTTFTRQLSTLQDAGLPLLRSVQILEDQQKPGILKNVLIGVSEDVEGGTSLSEAMAKHPKAFNTLYTKMVAAGEVGGVLDVILQRLAEFMEKAERLKAQVVGAMIYPVAVILVAVGIVIGIMILIIPKFKEIFEDFEVELPAMTVLLMDTSSWLAGTLPTSPFPLAGGVYIVGTAIFVPIFIKIIRTTKPGKAATDWILLHTPIMGKIVKKSTIARFTRTLGTLVAAGVPILEAITITRDTCGNWVYEKALTSVHDSIKEGESFAEPLRESRTCDPIVVNMINVGEETGDLDTMLMKIADNYDEEVDTAVASLVSLIEPLLVIVLGGIVGSIVVAMFLPLVKMIESLQ